MEIHVFDPLRIIYGIILSGVIGGLAYRRRSLTIGGWLGAVVTGTCTVGFGGWSWGLLLITFFVTSSLLSHYKEQLKAQRVGATFAKGGQRDFAQALANGGLASLLALLYALVGQPELLYGAYIGVLATVTADTWATELGVLSSSAPRLITNGHIVEPGTSGGITRIGTTAAAGGGLLIGIAALLFSALGQWLITRTILVEWGLPFIGLISGLAGAFIDSFLGATLQAMYRYADGKLTERAVTSSGMPNESVYGWHWMNNDAVNMISSIGGGIVAMLIWLLIYYS